MNWAGAALLLAACGAPAAGSGLEPRAARLCLPTREAFVIGSVQPLPFGSGAPRHASGRRNAASVGRQTRFRCSGRRNPSAPCWPAGRVFASHSSNTAIDFAVST